MTPEQYREKELELFNEYNIPEELRSTLSYMAYESGHSAGHYEVILELTNLVHNLSKPIQKLIERITKNNA